ncbi:MAG TPA: hypothetical protein VNN22_07965 [Verrucomicrobiae bacterium]|nr:hypothetical protein [Verrucomicrobiae bacterium]
MSLLEAISPTTRALLNSEFEAAHLQRLRDLNRRIAACEEAGNSEGCDRIQNLIDAENLRWSLIKDSQPTTERK